MITLTTKIEEVVKENAKMMDYFNDQRIDYCCNGFMTMEEVAKEKGIEKDEFLDQVNNKLNELNVNSGEKSQVDLEEFKKLNIDEMVDSIYRDHHEKERDYLFEIDKMLNKILRVHFEHHGQELLELHLLFGALKTELEQHFVKEEKITFPMMLENPIASQEIIDKIEDLEADHEKAGEVIKQMIELTDGFTPPQDGCNTYSNTFMKLDELTKDVFVHIFKENSIMFEKYQESRG